MRESDDLYALFGKACSMEAAERERLVAGLEDRELAEKLEALLEADLGEGAFPRDPVTAGSPSSTSAYRQGAGPLDVEALRKEMEGLASRREISERYEMGGELGRGGMGTVRRIVEHALRRELAMKTIRADGAAGSVSSVRIARFLTEARILGRLDHPGIVSIHELGVDEAGNPYFTMPVVEGNDLRAAFEKARAGAEGWSMARAVDVLLRVCEAMAYAHANGVIHRDLKPSNVMVGRFGEVQVMDWGLGRLRGQRDERDLRPQPRGEGTTRSDDSPVRSMDGQVLGTPFYMPPEQAAGDVEGIGEHSDVYAVGAMLYELLSGQRPYERPGGTNTPYAVLARIAVEEPVPIAELEPRVTPELAAICTKAMRRDAANRYAGMEALAADLRSFLEGRVVSAHRTGPLAELGKWVQRNRGTAASLAGTVLVILLALGLVIATQARASENIRVARDEAVVQAETASEISEFLARLFSSPTFEQHGRNVRVVDVLEQAVEDLDSWSVREPHVEIYLRRTIASALFELSRYELAQTQYERAVGLLESESTSDEAVLAEALYELASTQWKLNDIDGAATTLERGIALASAGKEAELIRVALMNFLAVVLKEQGHFEEAEPLYVETIDAFDRLLGSEAEETLTAINNYAYFLEQGGRDEEALPLHRKAFEGRRRLHGENHPATLNSMDNLAICLTDLERYEEAIPLARAAYEMRREELGEHHDDTLTSANNLGRLLMNAGRLDEAVELLRLAWKRLGEKLGPHHVQTLHCLTNLSEAMELTGRADLAVEYRMIIVEGRRIDRQERPHELPNALDDLGALHRRLGSHEGRIDAYSELADLAEEMGDPRTRARALHEVGAGHLELRQLEEGFAALEYALGVWEDAALVEDRLLLSILEKLALALAELSDNGEDALSVRERARELEERLQREGL